ncbi:peptide-methionine (S)-S-oxide reductase MsrA [Desulfotalea psychrophila]|uniref:Peptide methionine sulfoxide reductase MsrA n=1 Tax=Desulfotalea psychrophila (strain LSv54 / DSM 12343) TaxID=177439 RepID=Q6ARI1_DESPS|nr:peptide-methionine (S)-S-oxide reductase MsrA [Desulfotalea psychrophila]CAG35044.1 related to peptide methionine sulfoxide reductase [Desulfotalea psychrophila LSv54]
MKLTAFLLLILSLSSASQVMAKSTVLAGGCFWCMESDFEKLDGVSGVVSGFSGGILKNPTYNGRHTGHVEAVQISYDPQKISYRELLEHYWFNIDPFDDKGQFCDKGPSYLAAIFVASKEERHIAEESKRAIEKRFPNRRVITPILKATTFYPIKGHESYHQDYYKKSAIRYKLYRWNCGRDRRLQEIWGDRQD